jgi:hypothetical protein
VLQEEIGEAMEITELGCKRYSPGETDQATFFDFTIYMALTDSDMLTSTFEDNWIPGTRYQVFYRDSMTITNSPDDWVYFTLDTPYWYNGQENLIIEFLWSDGTTDDSCMYSWHWDSGTIRSITAEYSADTGTMSSLVIMFMLQGELELSSATFAEIKSLFGT